MPTKRCCCHTTNPCPPYCYEYGNIYNCSIESTEFYGVSISPDAVLLGTGPDLCCIDFWDTISESPMVPVSGCTWSYTLDACVAAMTLVIISATEATLTIDFGGGAFVVYKSDAGYDPLCRSIFTYSAVDSTPPTTCQWYSRLCVVGINTCCPDMGYPEKLYVSWFEVDGNCPCIDDSNDTYYVSLVYVNPAHELADNEVRARWTNAAMPIGSCGTAYNFVVVCKFRTATGYEFEFSWDDPADPSECGGLSGGFDGLIMEGGTQNGPGDPDVSCLPFAIGAQTIIIAASGCCPDSENNGIIITL